eukprot:CAMPEP_0185834260 /NCGR_PEP_ID=MMETSP1353-20130828/4891_1 /TAXON_ID=1077150 /ORGANISM="Erythrolobus australicus, Strain CCMP3124" /LENGTH=77 /DNA_ID=CAMNT_0028532665 /DNA_START=126 /DNA_END=359 /DNA_ORIENTATION=+
MGSCDWRTDDDDDDKRKLSCTLTEAVRDGVTRSTFISRAQAHFALAQMQALVLQRSAPVRCALARADILPPCTNDML